MTTTSSTPAALRSGNRALNDQFIATQLTPAAATTKTMSVAGVVLDFGAVEAGVEHGAPKQLEWYMGFSLMVTLVWLYLTLLRLLAFLTRNR